MVVPLTLRALRTNRIPLGTLSRRTYSGKTCDGPNKLPPCPPCKPCIPPCRPRHPHPPRALRVVCCPPRPVRPPPCKPEPCSKTCRDITRPKHQHHRKHVETRHDTPSSKLAIGGQDIVAQRLQCAARARQLDYEREVARSMDAPPAPREPPPAHYALGAQREILRSTDGRLHAVPRTCTERPRCSCSGVPPPPRSLTLEEPHNPACDPEHHLDPCAHQPRLFVEIDRSASLPPCPTFPSCPPTPALKAASSPLASCPSKPSHISPQTPPTCSAACPRSSRHGGRRIDDHHWCSDPPISSNVPQRCRPVSLVERLRARTCRSTSRGPKDRRLHTSATTNSLQEMLRSREQLGEVGRGRVMSDTCMPQVKPPPKSPDGKLELNVPVGTCKVRVKVFLDGSDDGACVTHPVPPHCRDTRPHNYHDPCNFTKSNSNDSWLSIKNIQKKFQGCSSPKASCPEVPKIKKPTTDCPPQQFSGSKGMCSKEKPSEPCVHRTKCPPPPIRLRCPTEPEAAKKPPPTSPCSKPANTKECMSKSSLLTNIVFTCPHC